MIGVEREGAIGYDLESVVVLPEEFFAKEIVSVLLYRRDQRPEFGDPCDLVDAFFGKLFRLLFSSTDGN